MANSPMSDDALKSWINSKLSSTLNEDGNELSRNREENYDYYMGKPYGDEREGYSKFTTREVFEAVEWAMPSLMRAFTAGDRVVAFSPTGPGDEEEANQETDIVNHFVFTESDGFVVIYEAIKDALINPNAYVKAWMDESVCVTKEEYSGVNEFGLLQISETEGVEIIEQDSYIQQTELGPVELFDLKIKRTSRKPKLCIDAVAPENLRIDSSWKQLNLDDCPFICHEEQRPKKDLVALGCDSKRIDELSSESSRAFGGEAQNRAFSADESHGEDDAEGMEKHWLREIFVMIDYDGDGIAERRKVVMIGDEIFENEEYDYQPYVSLVTMLTPHRHVGYSLAESVKDLQRLSSQLMRQILNNAYRLNNQRKYVGKRALVEGGMTLEALEDVNTEIIPVSDPSQIIDEAPNSVIAQLVPVVTGLGDMKKIRTGISPELSLNPEILRESTAGAFMNALENASQRIEMVTRLMAETGIKWLMLKIHRLLREHMDIAKTIRIRGKWVNVNPADWPERPNVDVSVGLGFNSKDKTVAAVMSLLQIQREAFSTGMVRNENIYSALSELVSAYGFKAPEMFFTPPDQVPQQQQGPSPDEQAMQAQMQMQAAAVKAQQQAVDNDRARVQIEAQQQQIEIGKKQLDLQQKQQELDQKAEKLNLDATKMMSDIQQGWAKINQQWADIELKYGRDLNEPGIGQ